MKRFLKLGARRLGYDLTRLELTPLGTMEGALKRLAVRHPVSTVIDVGASDGRWSRMCQRYYPDASYLLFEAQVGPHGDALSGLAAFDDRFHPVLAAAGDASGTIHFDASDPWGGVASTTPTGAHDVVVPMTTVDAEVARFRLPPPYLLKLDTHGFEVPCLKGAEATLERASLLVIEAYNFQLRPDSLRFHELCAHLEEKGFRVIDLVDPMWRPRDEALWQFDLFFIRDDEPQFDFDAYA